MKRVSIIVLYVLLLQNVYSQEIVDRSEQVPVEINAIFFMADYEIMNNENRKYSFADMGLGKGQVFTYKGFNQEGKDYQSLVLINAFIYDEDSGKYKEFSEYRLAIPNKPYKFKILLACMSRIAASPRGASLSGDDITPSGLGVERNEIDKFKLKYRQKIDDFLDKNINRQLAELKESKGPSISTTWTPGPRPTTN